MVTLNGKDHYLGTWKTTASKAEYNRLIGEWLAAGRCLPTSRGGFDLTVAELAAAYWTYAKGYYQKNGQPTRTLDQIKLAVRLLRTDYGPTLAHDFGPLALQAIQRQLAAGYRCRKYCNCLIDSIRRVFKWAASQELLPVTVHQALATVPGLRRGRSSARETEPIKPVENEVVETTLPHLPPIVADMVQAASAYRLPAGRSLHPSPMRRGHLGGGVELPARVPQDRTPRPRTGDLCWPQGSRRAAPVLAARQDGLLFRAGRI